MTYIYIYDIYIYIYDIYMYIYIYCYFFQDGYQDRVIQMPLMDFCYDIYIYIYIYI